MGTPEPLQARCSSERSWGTGARSNSRTGGGQYPAYTTTLLPHRLRVDPVPRAELPIRLRRDLARLDLAPPAPEHVRVADRDADRRQVLVDGPLVGQDPVLFRS